MTLPVNSSRASQKSTRQRWVGQKAFVDDRRLLPAVVRMTSGPSRTAEPRRSGGGRDRESSGRPLRDSGAAAGPTSRGRGEGGAGRRERTDAGPAAVRADAVPAASATGGR